MTGFRTKLTFEQQDRICRLAVPRPDGRRLSTIRIAAMIGATRGSVAWFMYRHGLRRPVLSRGSGIVDRRGRRRFTAAEDALMQALRLEGKKPRAIAAALEAKFGHPRGWRSVKVRLIILAGFEAEAEDRAERQPSIARRAA